ncbi:MAG: SDR family NAD(P)-dependent oxidoreductase [Candidatus Dadabacteria bacterium]|nr:MAG: SDR family NAD(P)-dependent oxidoreductase [Candidatus Dadabacteria bacterium]
MRTFRDRVAVVTGAASGIGRALAEELGRRGARLAISDINEAGVAEVADRLRGQGVDVLDAKLDVADRDAVFAHADAVLDRFGTVNLVINNAGVALGATVSDVEWEDFEWLMNINFWGVVYGTKAFLPHLKAAGEGHIVNISSVFGLIGVPTQSVYNAAKFAVRGFTEALREELDIERCGVSATCVHPGGIRTNIARSARVGGLGPLERDPASIGPDFDKVARTSPEQAARAILRGVRRNQRRVLIGPDAVAIDLMQRLAPTGYQAVLSRLAPVRR